MLNGFHLAKHVGSNVVRKLDMGASTSEVIPMLSTNEMIPEIIESHLVQDEDSDMFEEVNKIDININEG